MLFAGCEILFLSICISFCHTVPLGSYIVRDGANVNVPVNIIGGNESSISKHPYQVAILINGVLEGAGIIIDEHHVATLASVIYNTNASQVVVSTGSTNYTDGEKYNVTNIKIHEKFNVFTLDHDFALLYLRNEITFGKNVKRISLARRRLAPDSSVTLSGWGDSSPSRDTESGYKELTLKLLSRNLCKKAYPNHTLTNTMLCALNKEGVPCWHDFGDVIVQKGKAFGLFSWSKGCEASDDNPGVFTDLVAMRSWIETATKSSESEQLQNFAGTGKENYHIILKRSAHGDPDYGDKQVEYEELKMAIQVEEAEEADADEKEKEQEREEDKAEADIMDLDQFYNDLWLGSKIKEDVEKEVIEEERMQELEEVKEEREAIEMANEIINNDDILSNELDKNAEEEVKLESKFHPLDPRDIPRLFRRSIRFDTFKGKPIEHTKPEEMELKRQIIPNAHTIAKRSLMSFVDYDRKPNDAGNNELELAIKEELKEEANAEELEKEQEAKEEEKEEEALKAVENGEENTLDINQEIIDHEDDSIVDKDAEEEKNKGEMEEDDNDEIEESDAHNKKNVREVENVNENYEDKMNDDDVEDDDHEDDAVINGGDDDNEDDDNSDDVNDDINQDVEEANKIELRPVADMVVVEMNDDTGVADGSDDDDDDFDQIDDDAEKEKDQDLDDEENNENDEFDEGKVKFVVKRTDEEGNAEVDDDDEDDENVIEIPEDGDNSDF